MGPHQKRLLREWENDAAASHSQREVENSNTGELKDKRVCQYCKREFSCGRGLGGHIKVHFRNRRKTKFTHRKLSRKRDIQSCAPPHTRKISYSRKDKDKQDGGSDVVIDLSKSISGCGWKGHRKRGCNEREIIVTADQDSDGDGDDDDGDSILMEMLKRSGFSGSAHQISRIRRYVCNTCNVVLPTFHAVRCHVNDSDSSPNNDDDDHEEEVDDEDYEEEEEEEEYDGNDGEEEMGAEEDDDDNDNDEEEEEDDDDDDDNDDDDDDDDNDDDEDDDEEEEEVEEDDDEEEEEIEEEVGVEASMEVDEVAEENDDDDNDNNYNDKEDDDEEEEEVEDEVGAEAFMEVDEIADEEEQEVGAEAAFMADDEVADVEEEEKAAKASTEVDKVAGEEEEGMGAKTSTQVDEVAEACDNSGSMDQKVSTSNPPKKLDFDLNEMPPEED